MGYFGIGALGYTIQRPTEDRYLMTCEEGDYRCRAEVWRGTGFVSSP